MACQLRFVTTYVSRLLPRQRAGFPRYQWGRDIIGLLVRDLNLASEYYSQAICWREKRYRSCIQLIKSYVLLAFEEHMAKGGLATLYQVLM